MAGSRSQEVTRRLPTVRGPEAPQPHGLAAAWADPARRPWLVVGTLSLLLLVGLIFGGSALGRRYPLLAPAGHQAQPVPTPAAEPPPPAAPAPGETQPSPPAPPAEPAAPVGPWGTPLPAYVSQFGLAALPLLLGLFWLLSAWLVDAEARRAFVVQEPWGERRTLAYSCLAVGCVFPLILAGLIFAAWGFVSFVLYVASKQSWIAGIQAGALILLAGAVFLLIRGAIARWYAGRRAP